MSNNKPPYLLGLLGIIPLVGAFVGFALILYGIFRYKDRKLIIIGSTGVLFSVLVYSLMFYELKHGKLATESYKEIAQKQLNSLSDEIELYKLRYGSYPDSLSLLPQDNYSIIFLYDPFLSRKGDEGKNEFPYKKLENHYTVFSVGPDCIPQTSDDIFPVVHDTGRFKSGFIKE